MRINLVNTESISEEKLYLIKVEGDIFVSYASISTCDIYRHRKGEYYFDDVKSKTVYWASEVDEIYEIIQ